MLIPAAYRRRISSMITFRRLYITVSLRARRQRGPYRSSNPCTDGPLPKPSVHSLHSYGTVEIVRESTYSAAEERDSPAAAAAGGEGGRE